MKQLYGEDDKVKIADHADRKYNNTKKDTIGTVFDIYFSDKHGEYVYEVLTEGTRSEYLLVHQADLIKM